MTCCQWILSHSWHGGELICMPECVLRFQYNIFSLRMLFCGLAFMLWIRRLVALVSVAKEGRFSVTIFSLPQFCLDQCHFVPMSESGCTFVSTGNQLWAKKRTDFGVKLRGGVWRLHVSPSWGWSLGQVLVVFPFGARFARLAEMAWEADSQHQLRI